MQDKTKREFLQRLRT